MFHNNEIEQDYVLSDLQFFREYDMSNFISSANSSLGKISKNTNNYFYQMKFDTYLSYIDKSLSRMEKTKLVSSPEYMMKILSSINFDEISIHTKPIIQDDIIIRPKYLIQFVDNIGLTIQRFLKNKNSSHSIDDEIDLYISSDIMNRVRRQIIKSSLPSNIALKDLIDFDEEEYILISNRYRNDNILPVISSYDERRKSITSSTEELKYYIDKVRENLNIYLEVLEDEIEKAKIANPKDIKDYQKTVYNTYRSCCEVISYVCFMMIRKISIQIENVIRVNLIYDSVANTYETESAFDRGLVTSDSKSIGERLLVGEIDAFRELATDIYEYNSSLIASSPFNGTSKIHGEQLFSSVDFETEQLKVNEKPYTDTLDMISIISQGLDTIAKNSDDYLIVFDDILEKSGFSIRLEDKFAGTIGELDDISEYQSMVSIPNATPNMDVYFKLLKEIKEYPERMEKIADSISECKTKMNILSERFSKNINQEFQNTMTVRELQNFFVNLDEEYTNLVIKIGAKFMHRLKYMAIILEKLNKQRSDDIEDNYIQLESDALKKIEFESSVDMIEGNTDIIFESLLSAYNQEYYWLKTRKKLILEAEEDGGNGKKIADSIKTKINNWYEKVIAKIQQISDGVNAKQDQMYFTQHKNDLLNKNYTNVTTKNPIIEYEKLMPFANITTDMRSLVNKTSPANLSPQRLQSITDQESAAKILFGNRPPIDVWKAEKISDAITKFYKCGNYQENLVTLHNNEVKAIVEDAVNYCEPFYQSFLPQIRQSMERIKNNIENVVGSLVNESAIDEYFDSLFTEAETNQNANQTGNTNTTTSQNKSQQNQNNTAQTTTQTQQQTQQNTQQQNNQQQNTNQNQSSTQQNTNTVGNMANKAEMIQKMVQQYCNGILTASFDRYKDYMALLKSIIAFDVNNNQQPNGDQNNPPQV